MKTLVGLVCLAAAGFLFLGMPVAAAPASGPAPAESTASEKAVGPAVCALTAENKWGIPMAVATGFLLGDGRFVVTDLGVVAQPGVGQVILKFQDGPSATARQFGMADTGLGLAALRLEGEAPARPGLALAPAPPALDGSAVVTTAGWRWGKKLDVATGRLQKGPLIKDVAARAHVEAPAGVDAFMRIEGGRLEAATGSPLLDATGTVIGVRLDVVFRDSTATLAMPASTLRGALLSTPPQLKPLSEFPKPVWPTRYLRLAGEPVAPAEFARAVQTARATMACPTCGGKGRAEVLNAPGGGGRPGGGWPGGGGRIPPTGRGDEAWRDRATCRTCNGERSVVQDTLLPALGEAILQGTRIEWAPTTDDRTRASVRAETMGLLKTLAEVGPRFDRALADAVAANLGRPNGALPRGIVLRAEIREHLDGPDGKYLLLAPPRTGTPVAVRIDDLAGPGAKPGARDHKAPAVGTWVSVAGAVLSKFDTGAERGLAVLPLECLPTAPLQMPDPRGGPPGGGGEAPPAR